MVNSHARVAFIGTGIMGAPIAGHLMDAGYRLTVYNRSRDKAQTLLDRGARWAGSPAEAAGDADVVFTMVGTPTDVEDVYLASDGLLRAAKRGAWLIDLTTSSPELARDIYASAEVEDKHAFDCPVTGGQEGAEAGTLTLFVGAAEKDVQPVLPLLQAFSSKAYYFGEAGRGQVAKLCNQVSLASAMLGYAEAMTLAESNGLDVAQVLEAVGSGMGGSVAMSRLAPRSLEGDYRPGFLVEHLRKDLRIALATAEDRDAALPATELAENLYDLLCQVGGSRMGTQAITLLYGRAEEGAAAGLDWSKAKVGDEGDDAAPDAVAASPRDRYRTPGSFGPFSPAAGGSQGGRA